MGMSTNEGKESLKEILETTVRDPSIYKEDKAKIIIQATSLLCGIVAAQPIPFADIFVLTPIQLVMVTYLNKIKGNPYKKAEVNEVLVSLLGVVGWGTLAQHVILGLYKSVLPFLGAVTTIPLVYGATYALGKCTEVMIEAKVKDQKISDSELKKLAEKAKAAAKSERGNMGLAEAMNLLSNLKNTSKEYNQYVDMIKKSDLYHLLKENETAYEDIFDEDSEISDIFEKRQNRFEQRLKSKYPNIQCSRTALFTLMMLPSQVWLQEGEPFIAQIYHDISKLNILTMREIGRTSFMKVSGTIGKMDLVVNDEIFIQKVDLSDQYRKDAFWRPIEEMTVANNENLYDGEVKYRFYQMLEEAENEICIISPWANKHVAEIVIPILQQVSKRGVKVKIIYGYSDSSDASADNSRERSTDEAIAMYKEKLGEALVTKKDNTHVKLCVVDDYRYLFGSYNFLSFSGDYYKKKNVRKEYSTYGENRQKVQELKEEYFKDM